MPPSSKKLQIRSENWVGRHVYNSQPGLIDECLLRWVLSYGYFNPLSLSLSCSAKNNNLLHTQDLQLFFTETKRISFIFLPRTNVAFFWVIFLSLFCKGWMTCLLKSLPEKVVSSTSKFWQKVCKGDYSHKWGPVSFLDQHAAMQAFLWVVKW